MTNKWNDRFFKLAKLIATWSKDKSTQVGAVIVNKDKRILSVGYNGFPQGIDDELEIRHTRPIKYMWTEHAERNAIYNAGNNGVQLKDGILYCTMFPCADCARAIIQSGISEIYSPKPKEERWSDSHLTSSEMLIEADVKINYLEK